MFVRHRKQLRAMAQEAKRELFTCGEQNGKDERVRIQAGGAASTPKIRATFPRRVGFTPQQKKGLRPPAIID
jgi:hypothetical protein